MSWKPEYILLILISTIVDYIAGIQIYKAKKKILKNSFLIFSLASNLGLLFVFKYFNFFSDSTRLLLQKFSIQMNPLTLKILLPVGISFYTFQTLSYTIDIYRGKIKPEKHFGIFAVYVSFFPQLVAGPIERAKHLLPQFYDIKYFKYQRVTNGLKLMLWGFFKKIVIADRLALIVNQVYNNVGDYGGLHFILATIFFAFQIYCDFSGYSDIAIGSAKIMGFNLMDNFKRPYFSKSVKEFWKRWHISLSTWFMDYLYIPLGGSKVKKLRWMLNILVVFLVSGLWHGANWTFIIWGGLHGSYLIIERLTKNVQEKFYEKIKIFRLYFIKNLFQISVTFCLVCLGWIFFRANNISDAIYIISNLFNKWDFTFPGLGIIEGVGGLSIGILSIIFMEFIHIIQEHKKMKYFLNDKPRYFRWVIYIIILLSILIFGVFEKQPFIYFQF